MAPKDEDQSEQQEGEGQLLDMSQADVKKMVAKAKAKGFITYDELNRVLPSDQFSSEQIEDVMSLLSEMGVNVVEADEESEESEPEKKAESKEVATTTATTTEVDRTDDPVRMYLREMGTVELLSREGEIAIAKRIEAGRATMIGGLCESPLTFQAITVWRDELLEERILLRDVIDLETTFGQSTDSSDMVEAVAPVAPAAQAEAEAPKVNGAAEPARPVRARKGEDEPQEDGEGEAQAAEPDDEDDAQANLSLAAMEASLKPEVLETLERIATAYQDLRALQADRMAAATIETRSFSAA
ncbi:MAG: RNA polymerase sigma factor region1.1 domain-containing protein, partial [Pseudomonadota bacterium]